MAQQSPLDLLGLPREIRDIIFKFVFDGSKLEIPRLAHTRSQPQSSGLLLACKQTHAEAIEVYYAKTHFWTYHTYDQIYNPYVAKPVNWIARLPERYRILVCTF